MTKTQKRIIEATQRGYRVEGSFLYGPRGRLNIKLSGNARYPTFSTNWDGYVFGIPVHHFAAYQYYGEMAFNKGIQIRHLNGNTLDFTRENIALGTSSQNQMDKCPNARRNAARIARASQGVTPKNAKLSKGDVNEIKEAYSKLEGRKAPNGFTKSIAEKYGISNTVIYNIMKGKSYAS